MDSHSLELLEFPKVRELLAGYTVSTLGREAALLAAPMNDLERIQAALELVTEMTEALAAKQPPPLGGLSDIRLLIRRAAIGSSLTPGELLHVKEVLAATGSVYRWRMRLDPRWQRLIGLLARLEDLGPLGRTIEGCIDSRGNVLDMASAELGSVRHRLHALDERIGLELKRVLRDPIIRSALRFPNATLSGDHHVLPVAVNHRQKVPGIVHRTSATGDTVYVEPAAIAGLNAERSLIKVEEEKEIARILRRLTAEIAGSAKSLHIALDLLAQLDLIQAKARYSREYEMSAPQVALSGRLWLRGARHPLLLHLLRGAPPSSLPPLISGGSGDGDADAAKGSAVVPIDVRLGDEFDMLIITGPNTGGKTVALKTTGLLCVMALSGMHIPAATGSSVPLLCHVLADIGDEQSLEQSLSTFSSHISRIGEIIHLASAASPASLDSAASRMGREAGRIPSQSLVLLDELGAGTDPSEGAALGRAILDQLAEIGCLAMVTTHLGDLKTYAFGNSRAENAAVEFDVQTLRPTYRLIVGQFGRSCALKIARRLKLPPGLLKRAHRYLRRRSRRQGELENLQRAREAAAQAHQEAQLAALEAQKRRDEYEQKRRELQHQAAAEEALRAFRQSLKPGMLVRVESLDEPGQIVRVDPAKGVALVRAGIGQWEVMLSEVSPSSTPGQGPDQAV